MYSNKARPAPAGIPVNRCSQCTAITAAYQQADDRLSQVVVRSRDVQAASLQLTAALDSLGEKLLSRSFNQEDLSTLERRIADMRFQLSKLRAVFDEELNRKESQLGRSNVPQG